MRTRLKYAYIVAAWNDDNFIIKSFYTHVESYAFYRTQRFNSKWKAGFLYDNSRKKYSTMFEKEKNFYEKQPNLMIKLFERYKKEFF